jgi:uracil-DNA glycosylase
MVQNYLCLDGCHADWKDILIRAIESMDKAYLQQLAQDSDWLPGMNRLFAAFSLPLEKTKYILMGESPYPRSSSANGYAFWDNVVQELWSPKGLSISVNKATSLRNWIKMMLVARGNLELGDISQEAIAKLDKRELVRTANQLFLGMMDKGILLLNASLVYSVSKVPYHARQWKPFMQSLLSELALIKSPIKLILLGKIAETVPGDKLPIGLVAEHPYNISFIRNQKVIEFFKPLDLLSL